MVGAWRELGCKAALRVSGSSTAPAGRASWKLRAPRGSRQDWLIVAAHCPYLGKAPFDYGDDAWRISIQVPDGHGRCEVAHLVARSEAEALASVAWLDAAAGAS